MYFLILEILQLQMWRQQVTNLSELGPHLFRRGSTITPTKEDECYENQQNTQWEEMSVRISTCCQ